MAEKCEECRGKGYITLLVSVVKCDKCDGTGYKKQLNQTEILDCFDEYYKPLEE
jgi:RecJ-like exonuclease